MQETLLVQAEQMLSIAIQIVLQTQQGPKFDKRLTHIKRKIILKTYDMHVLHWYEFYFVMIRNIVHSMVWRLIDAPSFFTCD